MKQLLQNLKTGELRVDDVPAPALRPGGVVVGNRHSLVSAGTDRATVSFARQSLLGKARSRPDLVRQVVGKVRSDGLLQTYKSVMTRLDTFNPLGYSSAGEVIEAGEGVSDVKPGDLVSCAGSEYATHAEVVYVPKNLIAKLPEGVPTRHGAFATLGAIALQGIRRADITPGETVAVVGLGLVGQLTVQILTGYGFPVFGVDVDQARVDSAGRWGLASAGVIGRDDIEALAAAFSGGHGVDAVIVTAATRDSSPVELAGQILREQGRVSVVGDVGMNIPRRSYYAKELDLRVSRSYGPGRYDPTYEEHGLDYPLPHVRWTEQRNMQEFLRLVAIGRVDPEGLITHTFAIDRAVEAYSLVLGEPEEKPALGVLLEYGQGPTALVRRIDVTARKGRARSRLDRVVRVGLIGAGSFARSTIIPILAKLENVQIRGVASATGRSAKEIAERHRAEYATTDYTELLEDDQVDLVVAATRHRLNAEIAAAALRAGKHVHVEKPLALTRTQLREVAEAASASPAMLMVGFNRRFAPHVVEAKGHFANRTTPLMMHYRVNAGFVPPEHWVHDEIEGGGRIIGEVCHFVDLLHFFAGSTLRTVYATRLPPVGQSVLEDDNVLVAVDFEDGSLGSILYSALGAEGMTKELIEVFGDRKSAVIDDFRRLELYEGAVKSNSKGRQDKGHRAEFQALVEAVQSGGPAPIPVEELLLGSLATICITESLASATRVVVDIDEILRSAGQAVQATGESK